MGKYLITSDRVLFVHEKEEGWVSWEEFASSGFIKEEPASVLLTEIEFRKGTASVVGDTKKNTEAALLFPTNMAVQEEPLKNGICQCAGVRSERLHEVLGVFSRGSVRVCVPYALSIRAFLIAGGLFEETAARVVVEEVGGVFLLSIFDGMQVVSARALSGLSLFEVAEELARSLKRNDVGNDPRSRFIVNNKEIAEVLLDQEVCSRAQMVISETTRMSFSVLDRVTFKMNFLLPDEIARQRRKEWQRRVLVACGMSMCIVLAAVFYLTAGMHVKNEALTREQKALAEMGEAEQMLKDKSIKVFQAALEKRTSTEYEKIFQALLINTPGGWKLEKVDIYKQGPAKTLIAATFSGAENDAFICEGIFRACRPRSFFASGTSWVVVSAEVKQQGDK